tara:strand:- start:679 stop:1119 length:441 start_codon:yes stop_codon:yes gene_type:complete
MLKTLLQTVDIYYILLVAMCVSFIVGYGSYRCKINDKINNQTLFLEGKPIFKIDALGFEFDRWSISHILFFALIGFLYPKAFYISMIVGVIWEFIEFSLGYFKPKWFFDNWCAGVNSINEWWFYRWNDLIMNCIGFLIGMNLSKIM